MFISLPSIPSSYRFKTHAITFIDSVFFCILLLITDDDFGTENIQIDWGTIICMAIIILTGQFIAFIGHASKVRSNYILASFCYSIMGVILGFFIALGLLSI